MVDFETPYAMDGTIIPGAGLRRQLQQSAGPGSGVLRPGDFRISQMDVPGTGVKIRAGDDLVQCRAPGRDRETYGVPLLADQVYMGDGGDGIPGTGSSGGRRDMIIHEILDPDLPRHFTPREEWPEDAYSKLSVVSGVPASAKTVADVPALNDVTCYELAAINWPASTGTITNAMLEDLRVVHRPQEKLSQRSQQMAGEEKLTAVSPYPAGTTFPLALEAAWEPILIPDWATEMVIRMTWAQVRFPPGNQAGRFWVQVGKTVDPDRLVTPYNVFDTAATTDPKTESWIFSATVKVPPVLRGTLQKFFPRATNNAAAPESARPSVFWGGSMDLDVIFRGAAA